MFAPSPESVSAKAEQLVAWIKPLSSCVVAFSGGVDSAVVAKAAFLALGPNSVAVTGCSPAVPLSEREIAAKVASEIGIRHEVVDTQEGSDPRYIANDGRRCYFCKSELYGRLNEIAKRFGGQYVLSGTNADDLNDYRPGLQAAAENNVIAPLAELNINKASVRQLARYWNLTVSEKPASPCLASRVAYGEQVTPERLAMIEQGELYLRNIGFNILRVRWHAGPLARIELPLEDLPRVLAGELRNAIDVKFRELGFRFVTIDLAGFRSGSQNAMLPMAQIGLQIKDLTNKFN